MCQYSGAISFIIISSAWPAELEEQVKVLQRQFGGTVKLVRDRQTGVERYSRKLLEMMKSEKLLEHRGY